MIELTPFLKELISLPGLSAYEDPVRNAIANAWKPVVDELTTSRLGSLYGLCKGSGSEPRPGILLAAHMDAIGLMVTGVVDGFLRFTEVGGIDPRILPGLAVLIHGRRPLPGIIVQPPDHLLPPAFKGRPVDMEYLLIDTGLLPEEAAALVRVGDLVSFDNPPVDLSGDLISGHSLDNRASVTAVTLCLQELQHIKHTWDVWAVATVQEEETLAGGFTSPYDIRPSLTVAVDVTFAKGPGASDYRNFPLGKGPTLGWGPNIHPAAYKEFKKIAEELDIPFNTEIMPTHSGTDGYAMQVVQEGVPSMVIGIPLRYMHTPVEVAATKDIARAGHLVAEFIARLQPEDIAKLTWEN
jgi:tetrahedral aminopeptidase